MNRLPNMIWVVFGAIILAVGISFLSIVEWLLSNLATIIAGFGILVFLIIFIGCIYSYLKDTKEIKKHFNEKEANELITSLRKKTLASVIKIFVFMIVYGLSWFVIIMFINAWLF